MNILKFFGKMGFGVFVFVFLFSFFPRPAFALLTDVQCQEAKGSCVVNNPTCTDGKRIDGCTFGTDGQVRTCCGAKDPVQENKDVECAKVHKGRCFYQNQTKDICSAKKMELKGECESQDGAEMACCYDPNNPNTAYPDSNSTSPSGSAASLNYTPLENLPGFEGESGDFATYFKNIYLLALWIVGISALFMLVVGGFLYLSSAGNTATLGYAKKTIYGALIGLVIALISWLLLNTINADLTNLKLSGLSGAVGSGAGLGVGTPSAGTGPGGSTTIGTYTHDEAVAALKAAGIGITSSSGRVGCSDAGCTTLEGIPKAAIDNLIAIKKDCGCSFNVTGGTESGHASHGKGKPIVDVTQDTTLGNFLYSKAGGTGGATISKSPGYGISKMCVTTAWEKLNFGCGGYRETSPHFHLVF